MVITKQIGRAMSAQLDRVNSQNILQRLTDLEEENRALREELKALRAARELPAMPAAERTTATLHNGRPVLTWAQLEKKMPYSYHQIRRYTLAGWEHTIINGTYFVYVDQPLNAITKQKARRKN